MRPIDSPTAGPHTVAAFKGGASFSQANGGARVPEASRARGRCDRVPWIPGPSRSSETPSESTSVEHPRGGDGARRNGGASRDARDPRGDPGRGATRRGGYWVGRQ